jgi:hypothetical protein
MPPLPVRPPDGLPDRPHRGGGPAGSGPKRREIVSAHEERRPVLHGRQVEGIGHEQADPRVERRRRLAPEQGVPVQLPPRRVPGIEIRRLLFNGTHADIRRKAGVQGPQQARRVQAHHSPEAGDLPQGVDAGVGPAGPHHRYRGADQPPQSLLEAALDGGESRLRLPAMVGGPIVLQGELETARLGPVGPCPAGRVRQRRLPHARSRPCHRRLSPRAHT